MRRLVEKHADKLRFGVVGGLNTTIDFGILFGLVWLGLDKIASNFISTTIAFLFSFFANKTYTFKDTSQQTKQQFVRFLIITLSGLWLIQPAIIQLASTGLENTGFDPSQALLVGKLLATGVTLVWNYLLYRRFVFTGGVSK